eukprot:1157330-Prorocentrum_minimum.AAC.1
MVSPSEVLASRPEQNCASCTTGGGAAGGQRRVRRGSGGCLEGVRGGSGGGLEGKYRSSVDAREPHNPTKSEEHQKHLQGVFTVYEGHKRPKR